VPRLSNMSVMPQAQVGRGIALEYETFGDRNAEPLILVMGLAAQMILWPDGFCEQLAARGFYVVRFDNRDVGLSTKLHSEGVPRIPLRLLLRTLARIRIPARYSLSDMARDVVGLMDALQIPSAHVVGMSMGGMISQTLAIEHPERVRSLVSFASSSGDHGLPNAKREAISLLIKRPPTEREAAIQHGIAVMRAIGSPAHFDEAETRAFVERGIARSTYRLGAARQLAAILADAPRASRLREVKIPTTVIHGRIDPLLPLPHGEATARAIPNSKLVVIDGLGHDIPKPLWSQLIDAIETNTKRTASRSRDEEKRAAP
jgi:pimeloyl-ACP methyl ester carboxylesterase